MAGLALGVPTVTNHGPATEEIWEDGPVALVRGGDPGRFVATAHALLSDSSARDRLGEMGRKAYERYFHIERTLRVLTTSSRPMTQNLCVGRARLLPSQA